MTLDHLPVTTVDPESEEGLRWLAAVLAGFGEGTVPDELVPLWREDARVDGHTLYAVWPERSWASDPVPVATYASWAQSLNVGGGRTLPLHMVTAVTTAVSHRRRGLLRAMMTGDLATAARAGLPLAALTATEGSIYGRFGFGPAVRERRLEVQVTSRFALRREPGEDPGRFEVLPAPQAWPAIQEVFAAHLATTRGAVERPHEYRASLTGLFDIGDRAADPKRRVLLHLDADGRPDGYAVWRPTGRVDGVGTADVHDVLATSPDVELRVWRRLADLDLTERLRVQTAPVTTTLEWSLREPRVVRTTSLHDHLWLRVLDVPAALGARPWSADGTVVLGVDDPLGHAAGSWRVQTSGGRAEVTATEEAPEVVLDVEALGASYLGDVAVATLAGAGRATVPAGGDPEALQRWAAMADGGPAPYCATHF
ncbi:GNAT family N-acetyltransferase [Nocardioides sp. CFH 31398]|uniref:GNAT family N-acetyltransferase n=1 Tax=Nocardioides sp. CFH 31398 TaxID=2919579 RepID=UPI001F053C49|nr:GNAT family N-acetyltransferase [Nocardioides sp. CFH 31398]MCH1865889.1 GNAT family N-acetyltransferase [Nocardioides sp. CFH 31398]